MWTAVWLGQDSGRLVRSTRPRSPSVTHRSYHLLKLWRAIPASAGDMADRSAGVDALTQPTPSFRGERGVTVIHESLLLVRARLRTAHGTREALLRQLRCSIRVTNLPR
jgi:hypothetical protein